MLKRLTVAVAALFVLATSAFASGTIPFSLSQQLDSFGKPLSGCKFYTIQAGTTSTPQNAYQDSALTLPLPNPQTCDASGRLPQMFLADGTIKVRLTDKNGVTIVVADNIQVIGPSGGGGGGGGTVDPTTIFTTGDFKIAYGTSILSGFVRANGRTIGSATSGATERANADCQALFIYLWGADANLTVSGGRGASAAADFAANKTITLPDLRGRVVAGLDDMGNSAAGRLTATYFGTSAIVLGASGGFESHTLTTAQLAAHSHGITDPGHTHVETASAPGGGSSFITFTFNSASGVLSNMSHSTASAQTGITVTNSAGSGNPHPIVQPTMLMTIYQKL